MLNEPYPANGADYFSDVTQMAGDVIIKIKVHLSNSIYCPFCADEFMFEFSLQHHLEQNHCEELRKYFQNTITTVEHKLYPCTYCGAAFYLAGLIPKHLAQHHGNEVLEKWRLNKQNIIDYEQNKRGEPSIVYAICSPGMSDCYDSLGTSGNHASVRRKLRYDLKNFKELSNPLDIVNRLSVRSSIFSGSVKNFSKHIWFNTSNSKCNSSYKDHNNSSKFLTSTPINFLDDSVSKIRQWSLLEMVNCSDSPRTDSHLSFSKEKYQCARCKLTWDNNRDLVAHIKLEHRNFLRHLFEPKYRCSLCGVTYYRNKCLVKHCASAHAMK